VVAADDGVMPQTEEAINHAKAAEVPIVVAITKCDLPSANPMQVKQQLMIKGLQSEDFGGTTGIVEVSAVKKQGLEDLIERTGEKPYTGDTTQAILDQHCDAPQPRLAPHLSAHQPLLDQLLAKDAAQRISNARELIEAIEQIPHADLPPPNTLPALAG
jgi:translation elongation factor EF-Tu-like GTPase